MFFHSLSLDPLIDLRGFFYALENFFRVFCRAYCFLTYVCTVKQLKLKVMTTQDLFKLVERQGQMIETLARIVEKHEHWLHGDHKDIEKLQDEVDDLKGKLQAENKSNLTELFENLNPNK